MIHTTDTTARTLYDAMLAAALENVADEDFHTFKHGRTRLKVLHSNLRTTAAKVLKNWAAFGGGQKPRAEKTRTVTWPAGALSVFRAAMQDGDLAGAVRIAREKLGARAYQFRDGPMLAICPVPVPDIGEGFALLLLENGYYSVTDLRTGLKIGLSYKNKPKTLASARAEKARATPDRWETAMQNLAATPTSPDVLAEWCALRSVPMTDTAPEPAPAPEIKPVAPVSAPVAHKPAAEPQQRHARCKTARPPTPADAMARRASARKRQLQRAIAGQLAPHLVANLERCGLIRDGQATRRGRFLYLDDATI